MCAISTEITMNAKTSLALGKFTLSITEAKSEQEIYAILANSLPEMITANRSSVTLVNNNKLEVFVLHGSDGALPIGKNIKINNSIVGKAVIGKKTLLHKITEKNKEEDASGLYKQGIKSCINSPIVFSDRVIGTINIGSYEEKTYDHNAIALMCLVTSLVSTYLERQHLLQQAQIGVEQYKSYSEQLEALNWVAEQLSSAMTEDKVLDIVTASGVDIIKAQRISYAIVKNDNFEIKSMSANKKINMPTTLPIKNTSLAFALKSKEPQYFDNIQNSEYIDHVLLSKNSLNSTWCVPVRVQDKIVGLLNAASERKNIDGARQLGVLKMLSGIMGATLTRIKLQSQIEYNACYDSLTGLPNRNQFNVTLDNASESVEKSPFTLLFIDLDRFKVVNDTMGHDAGDELLCLVTQRIKNQVRQDDFVARHGGDEFVVLLLGCECDAIANALSTRIIESLKRPFLLNERNVFIGASIGISRFPTDSGNSEELLKYADIAMYHAKTHGRNNCQLYSEKLLENINNKQRLDSLLRLAIEKNELYLEFQPLMKNNQVNSVEALLRWQHAELGQIKPGIFIPVAEESMLIEEITSWVINKSLKAIKRLRKTMPELYVSVNVSAKDCRNTQKLQKTVLKALKENQLPGSALQLEITESMLLHDISKVRELLNNLKNYGIRFAIDDFGTGFSSLTYLLSLPIDTLKIDKSFIHDIQYNQAKLGVVKGIFDIADSLSVSCIAEGIETKEQKNCLTKLGCDQFQGYWFSRPLQEKNILSYIRYINEKDNVTVSVQ